MDTKKIGAGEFKQRCLALLDDVRNSGITLIITKRGQPVARLVPLMSNEEKENEVLRDLRGKARLLVDEDNFILPTTEDAGWNIE